MLLEKELISDENLGKVISDVTGSPFVKLSSVSIPIDILHIVPEVFARKHMLIAFEKGAEGLKIATSLLGNDEVYEFISKKTGDKVKVYYATAKDVSDSFRLYSRAPVSV